MKQMSRIGLLAVFLLSGSIVALTGCGAGNGLFAQSPQNYTVTATVTSSGVQHAINYTLNLQ